MKNYTNVLDLRNYTCPDSIFFLRKKFRNMKKKEIILLLSYDPSIKRDIPIFCNFMNHKIIEIYTEKEPYKYILQK
ncbi:sulfurtransferase TusA [Buchnera aphidicola (Ceratoglyphina bambusae)]|uniref:sulfurtransferase TusA n=1 Tax=Buchnera aphidicola TaxID=9 RepID=UPI0031B8305A